MRRTPGRGSVRLPRRGTDRIEDAAVWLLMTAALVLLAVSVGVALGVSASASARARAEAAERVAVGATVVRDVPAVAGAPGVAPARVLADATWTGPDGVLRTGPALVPAGARAGRPVEIWLDRAGRPADEPLDDTAAALAAVAAGTIALLTGGALLTGAWVGVRRWIGALNARGWEREWARIGPEWTGHGRQDAGHATD